jgi:outer membrane lipoprotein-sorting protein
MAAAAAGCVLALLGARAGVAGGEDDAGASAILGRVDAAATGGRDLEATLEVVTRAADGHETRRVMTVWQKGERRLVKVLEPARLRGVGLLRGEDGGLSVYLPAFGRTRRIVGAARDEGFAGTGLSLDDLGRLRLARDYHGSPLAPADARDPLDATSHHALRLVPKAPGETRHAFLHLYVDRASHGVRRIDYFDATGVLTRRVELSDVREVGARRIPHRIVVQDLPGGDRTEARVREARTDAGLDDALFTSRYLERAP